MHNEITVSVIANCFQPHYVIDLVNALNNNGLKVEFLGSDLYDRSAIRKEVNFINFRGSHDEKSANAEKVRRILKYYFNLVKYAAKTKNSVFHIQWFNK